jgi:hypothetical protein
LSVEGVFILTGLYESDKHVHIGYYGCNLDLEVIAYKVMNEAIWDIYIDEYEPGFLFDYANNNDLGKYIKEYGIKIYSIKKNKYDEDYFTFSFEAWLKRNLII